MAGAEMIYARLITLILKLLTALGLYGKGRADARQKAKMQAQKTYINKRKAMDNADADLPDDTGILRDWMRARDPDKR
jgi:hypothetical protein